MSHDDPTDSDQEPASAHARRMSPEVHTTKLARANARRTAFQAVLDRLGLRPAEVARRAGLPTANAIYNFANGHSDSLAQVTLERIAAALNVATEELMGLPAPRLHVGPAADANGPHMVPLLTWEAGASLGQRSPLLPSSARQLVPVPLGLLPTMRSAFAVRLQDDGAGSFYARGTIAICVPLKEMELPNPSTWRALVRLQRRSRYELTLHELAIRDTRCFLTPRSEDSEQRIISMLRWPPQEPALIGSRPSEGFITIEGIVVATWRPEGAFVSS